MAEEAPPPPPPDVWGTQEGLSVRYVIRSPWQWVMNEVKKETMVEVPTPADLPSAPILSRLAEMGNGNGETPSTTPITRRSRRMKNIKDKINGPSALKIEIFEPNSGNVVFATHGTSSALDGLEDKDALVRTLQRCRCDHLNLSPPSILINWDVTEEECHNVIGKGLPRLPENEASEDVVAVLKEPMGSQGMGIYFVRNVEEIHKVISEHRERAQKEPHFLDNLIAAKGRIPSWVLQAEVVPPLLIRDRRKFHIRTYLVVIENPRLEDYVDVFIYNRHEVRIAGVPVEGEGKDRDPLAHITNGALSSTTERVLLHDEPELVSRNMQAKVESFVAEVFVKHLLPDISKRVGVSLNQDDSDELMIQRFVVAGLDLMVTENEKIFLLEANVHPAAPPSSMVDEQFKDHLTGFLHDLIDLVVGNESPNFVSAHDLCRK